MAVEAVLASEYATSGKGDSGGSEVADELGDGVGAADALGAGEACAKGMDEYRGTPAGFEAMSSSSSLSA